MLISVVVPVYKVERYLSKCIDSILCQTQSDFELILVDDGSPDTCGKICDDYAQKDNRIKVIHQKNAGLSEARNSGIAIARGEYLSFIDSDDYVKKDYLERLYALCMNYNADISACRFYSTRVNDFFPKDNETDVAVFNDEKMKVFLSTKKIGTTAWGKLYKRNLFENIRYPKGKYNEDVFTTYLLVHEANRVVSTSYSGYAYRFNEMGIINEKYSRKKMDMIEAEIARAKFVKKYYPELAGVAISGITYACNQVLFSMAKSGVNERRQLRYLQKLYRLSVMDFINSKLATFHSKMFSIVAYVNIDIAWYFVKLIKRK